MQNYSSLCKDALFPISVGTCNTWLKNKTKHKMHPSNQLNNTKTTKTIKLESLC